MTLVARREGRARPGAGTRAAVYALLVLSTVVTLFPVAPLLLTMFSLEELLQRVLKMVL